MANIGILIDSASTYDEKFIKEHKIEKIALNLTNSKGENIPDDGTVDAKDTFEQIKTTKILWKTASTTLGVLMAKVEDMLKTYDKVIFVPVSYLLSGQYNNATMLLSEFPDKFFMFKSNKAVYENELVYKKLAECVESGMDAQEAIDKTMEIMDYSITIFSTLENDGLAKSGRTSKAMVKAMSLFKIKPIVEQYGKNHFAGMATSLKGALKKMAEYAKKRFNVKSFKGLVNSVCILETYGQSDEQKKLLREWCRTVLEVEDDKIVDRWLPLPVQVHTFPGSWGFCINCNIKNTGNKWTKDSDDE